MEISRHWFLAAALAIAPAARGAPPEWVRAEVVKVDLERSSALLRHEQIKSIGMDAMTMPFKVARGVPLARFKPGDKVRFTLVKRDDHLLVEAMEPAQ
jgi:Cu/Ag efflux protein CusF